MFAYILFYANILVYQYNISFNICVLSPHVLFAGLVGLDGFAGLIGENGLTIGLHGDDGVLPGNQQELFFSKSQVVM